MHNIHNPALLLMIWFFIQSELWHRNNSISLVSLIWIENKIIIIRSIIIYKYSCHTDKHVASKYSFNILK